MKVSDLENLDDSEVITDGSIIGLGSWADEMEDMPLPCKLQISPARKLRNCTNKNL